MSRKETDSSPEPSEETHVITDDERRKFIRTAPISGPSFRTGEVLAERFEIIRFLARGGMGEVYEARDALLHGTRVALKTILPSNALEPEARMRLAKEVMLAREITHPNVCPIYDFFESEQSGGYLCFLTMKLLQGETLAGRLRRQTRIPAEQAVLIARQLCAALRAAHNAGVVHRDFKPGNIMLEGQGSSLKAIVTDFGVAREHEADTTISTGRHILGTPGYIAPELFRGYPATPASDLYSLGIVLHEIFTGRKPFDGAGRSPTAAAAEATSESVPKFYARLIRACHDVVPEVRTREFERAVQLLGLDGETPKRETREALHKRRTILVAGVAATCAAATGVLWERGAVENLLHPLPRKRFVALLRLPPTSDPQLKPLVAGVLEAIESAFSRAEAFDRDLWVVPAHDLTQASEATELATIRDSFGANLALAAQGTPDGAGHYRLLLKVLDASTSAVLRIKDVVSSRTEIDAAIRRAVQAAAHLLNVQLPNDSHIRPSSATQSGEAYKAFQTAEDLMKEPNDAGLDKALDQYKAAIDADPRYAIAYAKLAVAYCRLFSLHGDAAALELARRNAEAGLRMDKNLVYGHLALSSVYDLTGKSDQALAEIGKALALDPANPKILFWQAQIYRHMNRWAETEQIYKRIMDLRPNYWPAYNDIGYLLTAQGKYRQALGAFREATVAAPRSSLAFNNLGDIYLKLGDFSQALENYRKSLALKPNDLAYCNMARALRAQGRSAEALALNLKAVEISPGDDLNWLDLADCYESMHKRREAQEAYLRAKKEAERVIEMDPRDGPTWIRLALYEVKSKKGSDIAPLISKAEKLGFQDLDTEVMEARIYEQLGERQKALAVLEKCFKKGLTSLEITFIPDLQALRRDPHYSQIAEVNGARPQ